VIFVGRNLCRAESLQSKCVSQRSAAAGGCDYAGWIWQRLPPLYRGVLCTLAGRYDQSIVECDAMLRHDPNNTSAYALRGWTHLKKINPRQAIADFDEAIRRDPANATIHVGRARAYHMEADYDHAIADVIIHGARLPSRSWIASPAA
jgi:Tfp pilus assembly protein PilF